MNEPNRTLRDFPGWITPSLVKELRQGMRTPSFLIMMSAFPAALSIIFLFSFIQGANGPVISQGASSSLFWVIISICLLTVIPLRALSAVKEECDTRSINLLILTKLTATRVILGKWISFMSQAAMLICITLPFAALRYYYGSINILQDIYFLFIIFSASCLLTAMSLWFSGMPSFCRIAFSLVLLFSGVAIAILLTETMGARFSFDLQSSTFWMTNIAIMIDAAVITLAFLFLSAKWFSSPAENISSRIRGVLLLILLPFLFLFLPAEILSDSFIGFQSITSILVLTIGIVLEASIPTSFLPIHVVQTGGQRFGRFRRFFLLPGWFGASRFALLIAVILAVASFCFLLQDSNLFKINGESSSSKITTMMTIITSCTFAFTWWSSLVIVFWLMSPLQKKLGTWNPILYFIVSYLFLFLSSVLHAVGIPFMPLFPWGSMFSVLEGEINLLPGINIAVGILALVLGGKQWKKTFRLGIGQLRDKREATKE